MRNILKASGFRAALLYVAALAVLTSVVLGLLYGLVVRHLLDNDEGAVWRDAAIADFVYAKGGQAALLDYIERAPATLERGQSQIYFLADDLGRYRGGNLRAFPSPSTTMRDADDWLIFQSEARHFRARLLRLDTSVVLLIGHDVSDTRALIARLRWLFGGALLGLVLIGGIGGWFVARRALLRVEMINHGLQKIMDGDLTTRITRTHKDDEWDSLTAHINAALARIDTLMTAMRQVTDNLAHELRSPLARLRTRLEHMLETAPALRDEGEAALADIDDILAVFGALLSLSRMESGAADEHFETLDIGDLVGDIATLYAPAFDDKKMQLIYTPPEKPLTLAGNRALLSQGVVNVLENALQHGAKVDSAVRLRVLAEAAEGVIEITDSGDGVPPEDLHRMTQRFVQLERQEKPAQSGHGLGLALVEAIARLHGGAVVLSPNASGGGLCVQIRLAIKRI